MTTTTDELAELRNELAEMRRQHDELRAQFHDQLDGRQQTTATTGVVDDRSSDVIEATATEPYGGELGTTGSEPGDKTPPARASRRNMLKLAAGAAAAGVTVAAASASGRVAATDGDHVTIGSSRTQGDTGRTTTVIDYQNSSTPQVPGFITGSFSNANIFLARDRQSGFVLGSPNASGYPAAVAGYAYRAVSNGVYGYAGKAGGYGTVGYGGAGSTGVLARGLRANVELFPDGAAPATRSDAHLLGEVVNDANGDVWLCTAAGSPGSWVRLGGPGAGGAVQFIAPARVYDSRAGFAPNGVAKGKLLPSQNRVIDCTINSSGVPASATGVIINLTAANTTGLGNLAVYPDGSAPPSTSSINYTAGVNIANSTTSGCGPGAKIRVQCGGSTGCQFIVDVVGFYR